MTTKAKTRECKECKGRIRVPKKLQVERRHYETDPFCSRSCCEKAHGIKHLTGGCSTYYKQGYGE